MLIHMYLSHTNSLSRNHNQSCYTLCFHQCGMLFHCTSPRHSHPGVVCKNVDIVRPSLKMRLFLADILPHPLIDTMSNWQDGYRALSEKARLCRRFHIPGGERRVKYNELACHAVPCDQV